MSSELPLLILLIALSGVFSGAEIALTSLSAAKVNTLKKDNRFGSSAVFKLKQHPEKLLITILIGNNLVNILTTVIATLWGAEVFGNAAAGIVTGALTVLILVFGEITPKTIAQKYAETFSRIIAHPLLWLSYILSPAVWLLNNFIKLLMKLFKANSPMQTMSEEELLAMVDIGTQEGVIEEHEQELIENVLEFTDTNVEEIMTVKDNIEALEAQTSIHDAARFVIEHSHSRIPVYKEEINNIIGIITVHDVLHLTHNKEKNENVKTLADLHYHKPIVVPKTKSIKKLFEQFQTKRQHMAIVVDERGNTVGLVTLEDIIEEIVGDITDEQDEESVTIYMIGDDKWQVNPDTTIEEINEALGMEIEYPVHQTVSLLILEQLQEFPKEGQKIEFQGLEFQVKKMSEKKIERVVMTKIKMEKDDEDEENK